MPGSEAIGSDYDGEADEGDETVRQFAMRRQRRAKSRFPVFHAIVIMVLGAVGLFLWENGIVEINIPRAGQGATSLPSDNGQPVTPAASEVPAASRQQEAEALFEEAARLSKDALWLAYESSDPSGCLAQSRGTEGIFVFGIIGSSDDLVAGVFNEGAKAHIGASHLTYEFDGRKLTPYFKPVTLDHRGNQVLFAGNYGSAVRFREEIARSNRLVVTVNNSRLVSIQLKGTRKLMRDLAECNNRRNKTWRRQVESRLAKVLGQRICADRPGDGELLESSRRFLRGGHKLTVDNGSFSDAIVKVRDLRTDRLAFSFFVQQGSHITKSGISDGVYRLQFARGYLLDDNCTLFHDLRASELEGSRSLTTKRKNKGNTLYTYTTNWSVTLYPVAGGNTEIRYIGAEEFVRD